MSEDVKKIIPCEGTPESCHGNPDACEKDPAACHANSSFAGKSKSDGDADMDDCLGRSLDQLSKAFMASAKRWEMVVYPSLFAFMILAAYGFYLIFSLTNDASRIADNMNVMTHSMEKIVVHMDAMSKNMVLMTQTVDSQSASMKEMTHHMRGMNMSMNQMRYDMSVMNNSVSRPMSFMNTFMPW